MGTYWPATLLCPRHCAGHLGGSREQNKPDSCPLESTDFLSESEEERVLGGQGPIGSYSAKDKASSTKEPEPSSQAGCAEVL